LFDDVQAVAFQADDGAAPVGQQDHVLDPQVQKDLGADAVIAQFALRPRRTFRQQADTFGQRGAAMLAGVGAGLFSDVQEAGALLASPRTVHASTQPAGREAQREREVFAAIHTFSQMSRHVRTLPLEEATFCKCGQYIGVRVAVRRPDRLLP